MYKSLVFGDKFLAQGLHLQDVILKHFRVTGLINSLHFTKFWHAAQFLHGKQPCIYAVFFLLTTSEFSIISCVLQNHYNLKRYNHKYIRIIMYYKCCYDYL